MQQKTKTYKKLYQESDLMVKCPNPQCKTPIFKNDLLKNLYVCPKCDHHFRFPAQLRIESIVDDGSFVELNDNLVSKDPLSFPNYEEKYQQAVSKTGLNEAILTGLGSICGYPVVIGVMEPRFFMASMGSVVGEKIAKLCEMALDTKCPLILFCASGGARMQEGMFSLMQMSKTSAMLGALNKNNLLYISVLTDPTYGGVTASFAFLGDIIIAEPGAMIGFSGKRVIEQAIKKPLPPDAQTAEYLLARGFIDKIIHRKDLKVMLGKLLKIHAGDEGGMRSCPI